MRFRASMKMMRFTIPYSDAELFEAVRELLAGNDVREDIHMHCVAYVAGAGMEATTPTGLYINPRRRGRMTEGGLRCCVSSWVRTSDNAIPIRLKCGANYQNGRLAALQAKADGYDSPIFLNRHGTVAEGSGATFFMVRKGKLVTPTITSDILESITRTTLIEAVAPSLLGVEVVERAIDRTELYVADEVFLCGTAARIAPVVRIDGRSVGSGTPGDLTRELQDRYQNVVRGRVTEYRSWVEPVYGYARRARSLDHVG